jgi:hypothetical protein
MRLFLSWSGSRSQTLATILRGWIPLVLQPVEPWMSASDIPKGSRWSVEIANELETARAGVICVTPENAEAPWLMFEAGALSKAFNASLVCTYLIDFASSELKGPLAQFQATHANHDETRALLATLNTTLGQRAIPEAQLLTLFDLCWPILESQIAKIEASGTDSTRQASVCVIDLLQEIRNTLQSQVLDDSHLRALIRDAVGSTLAQSGDLSRQEHLAWVRTLALRDGQPRDDTVMIDFRPLLASRGKTVALCVADYRSISEFLDQLWSLMDTLAPNTIPRSTYAQLWALEAPDGHLFAELVGTPRQLQGSLEDAGIRSGMQLQVVRIIHESGESDAGARCMAPK